MKKDETKKVERKTPPKMYLNKDEMNEALSIELQSLKDYAAHLSKLVEGLQTTTRSDVSFIVMDDAKLALAGMPGIRQSIERARRALKARANARMKE